MELVHPGVVVREQAEVPEWVDLAGEEWTAPGPVQAPEENAPVQNAERRQRMNQEHPATL
jgi:hypothetical protein